MAAVRENYALWSTTQLVLYASVIEDATIPRTRRSVVMMSSHLAAIVCEIISSHAESKNCMHDYVLFICTLRKRQSAWICIVELEFKIYFNI